MRKAAGLVVILEGPDGSGKTTLARALVDTFGLMYHHEGPPPPGAPIAHYYKTIFDQLSRNSPRGVVFDRLAMSEEVYGPVLRGRSGFRGPQYPELAAHLAANSIGVVCLPPLGACIMHWQANMGRELLKYDWQVSQVWHAYGARLKGQIMWDWTAPGADLPTLLTVMKERWNQKRS